MQGGGEIGAGVFLCLKGEGMRAGEDPGSQSTRPSSEMGQQKVREDSTKSWEVRRWLAAVGGGNGCALTHQASVNPRACQG